MSYVAKQEYEKYVYEHQNCFSFYNVEYTFMRICEKGMGVAKKKL